MTDDLYNEELAEQICKWVSEGRSLSTITKRPGMPCAHVIQSWLRRYPDFHERYFYAKEEQADKFAEEIIDIADEATDKENAPAIKVRIEARMWVASRLRPRVYGNHQAIQVSGPGGGPMSTIAITTDDPVAAADAYQRAMKGK
jgi:hypothetical protein